MKVFEVPSDIYGRVIESNLPLRFYWNKNGTFDGVEFTVLDISSEEYTLVQEILAQFSFFKEGKDWNIKDIK